MEEDRNRQLRAARRGHGSRNVWTIRFILCNGARISRNPQISWRQPAVTPNHAIGVSVSQPRGTYMTDVCLGRGRLSITEGLPSTSGPFVTVRCGRVGERVPMSRVDSERRIIHSGRLSSDVLEHCIFLRSRQHIVTSDLRHLEGSAIGCNETTCTAHARTKYSWKLCGRSRYHAPVGKSKIACRRAKIACGEL